MGEVKNLASYLPQYSLLAVLMWRKAL